MIGRFNTILVGLALITGVMLTGWGLAHLPWPHALPWAGESAFSRYLVFLGICTVLVIGGAFWSSRSALLVGAAIAIGLALAAGALWPLLVTGWFAVASTLLGRYVLAGLQIRLEKDNWLTNFLVGAGVYGTLVGVLAHFPVSYPGVYGAILAAPVLLGWRVVIEFGRNIQAWIVQRNHAGFAINGLDTVIAVVALIHFTVALMPEIGFDALAIHLFVPVHLVWRHQWGFDASTYVWAVMPMLGDWIFAIGYMLGGETASRLVNIGFIFVLGWLVRDLVIWAGESALGARWAALIFLSTPLTFTESSSLFIESVWASFVVAGTLAILRASTTQNTPKADLPLAGLFLGCALAAKAVTFAILPALLLLLAWRNKTWSRGGIIPSLGIGIGLSLAIGLIPYVTAWWLTRNPVFPFFNKVFQSPYYYAVNFDSSSVFGKGLTWDVLYRATFESGKYLEGIAGASGFQWLILLIPTLVVLVAIGQRKGLALLVVGVMFVALVFQSVSYLRYAFPAWAIISAAIGASLGSTENTRIGKWCFAAAVAVIALNILFLNAGARYAGFELESISDKPSRERYLSKALPLRNAVELVNSLNIERAPVAIFTDPLVAGLLGDALHANWYNYKFQNEIAAANTEQNMAEVLLGRGVNFVILDSGWKGRNCCADGSQKQELIEGVTERIAEFGSAGVRRIKDEYRYGTELLVNSDFTSDEGWSFAGAAKHDVDRGVVLVSVVSSAFQSIAVKPGRRYRNIVVARCAKDTTLGRIQINWSDVKGQFVDASLKVFECTPNWERHSMEVIAPSNAANAVVYATGHTSVPLEFKSNSLR